ncbi:ABC transporter substrate-binding protein [Gordonia sp. LSe1-13]|uniref:ABC transporter substrate-binding protein n=1 Tax=Gordonia sesuvii TaxID=3116777 RepID=A0ABU7MDW9_9ACTN|nr:ABC transporter substrate-binding protein [Gordonia sp. LSe1-13]
MRRVLVSIAATVFAAASLAACSGGSEGTEASGDAPAGLLREGQLSVCTDPEYPPMEYFADGDTSTPVGFDPDGARALADLWGLEISFQNTSFDGLMPALQAKRCDILWAALYLSPERLEVADGSPFMNTGPGLIVPTATTDITTADDLSGKSVAVQGGGSNELTLKDLSAKFEAEGKPGITVQPYPKTAETVAAVTNGKADALIETDVAVVDMVGKSNGQLKPIPGVFPAETKFGVFTLKESPLSPAVTEGLQELNANGTLAQIAEKYGLDPNSIVTE